MKVQANHKRGYCHFTNWLPTVASICRILGHQFGEWVFFSECFPEITLRIFWHHPDSTPLVADHSACALDGHNMDHSLKES